MKISEVVELKKFDSVIDLSWGESNEQQERLLSDYIVTEELEETFVSILESISGIRSEKRRILKQSDVDATTKRAHIISGQYGTGKSYFLLMLSIILEMKNTSIIEKVLNKFEDLEELSYQINYIKNEKKYLVVRINGETESEKSFKDVIQYQVKKIIDEKFPNEDLRTTYSTYFSYIEEILLEKFETVTNVAVKKLGMDLEDIKIGLLNYKKEYLDQAKALIKEVLGLNPQENLESLEAFFKDVNAILKRNGYSEVVIIFDEFSAYLSSSIEAGRNATDLGKIQELAQLTNLNKTDSRVTFIVSTHRELRSLMSNNTVNTKDELEKIFGRFDSHILAFSQGEDLIKNTLKLNYQNFINYQIKYRDYLKKIEDMYGMKLEDYYPLHPVTVKYLEPVSKNYAQKIRTTFSFLRETIQQIFFKKEVEENGKLNLVTLSDLYNYFEDSIQSGDKNIVEVFNQSAREIQNNIDREDKDLEDFLKAITIAYSANGSKSSVDVEISPEELANIYQIKDIENLKNKMTKLVSDKYVNITQNNGKYRLYLNQNTINLDELIEKEKHKIDVNYEFRNFLDKSITRVSVKKFYLVKNTLGLYPFDRELQGRFRTPTEIVMESFTDLGDFEKEEIFFVIPKIGESFNRERLIETVKNNIFNSKRNKCVAIPKEIFINKEILEEYGALKRLELNKEIVGNEELKKALNKRKRQVEDKLRNKYIRKFTNLKNFTFIFPKNEIIENIRQEIELFREIYTKYYYKFPQGIKIENFRVQEFNEILKYYIDSAQCTLPKKSTTTAKFLKIVNSMLIPLDLISYDEKANGTAYKLKCPEEKNNKYSREIMEIIENEQFSLEEKIRVLLKAPFGLIDNVLKVYLFVLNKCGRIIITNKDKAISLDDTNLKKVLEKPSDYKIEKNTVESYDQRLKDIWNVFAKSKLTGKKSKVKDFNIDGNNTFNVNIEITSEMNYVGNILKDTVDRVEAREISTGKLKTLSNKMEKINKILKFNEKQEEIIKIVEIFKKNTFEENLIELENLTLKISRLNSNLRNFENFYVDFTRLEEKIKYLNENKLLKDKLKEIELEYEEYKKNIYDIDKLNYLIQEINILKNNYNKEYVNLHNLFNDNYKIEVENLIKAEGQLLEAVKRLQKLKVERIVGIEDICQEIDNFSYCRIEEIEENKIISCKNCEKVDLKSLEDSENEIKERFKMYSRRIRGAFVQYKILLFDLIREEKWRENKNLRKLLKELNAVENNEEMDLDDLEERVEEIKEEFKQTNKEDYSNKKMVTIDEIEKKFHMLIQGKGENFISFETLEKAFKDIVDEYKNKNFDNIRL